MSTKMDRIRDRLIDLGWDVAPLDAAIGEVWQEGFDAASLELRQTRTVADPPPYVENACDDCGHEIECRDPHDCAEFACSTCTDGTWPIDEVAE